MRQLLHLRQILQRPVYRLPFSSLIYRHHLRTVVQLHHGAGILEMAVPQHHKTLLINIQLRDFIQFHY